MVSTSMQLCGFVLAFAGFLGLIVVTAMTEWKVSSYSAGSPFTKQDRIEGLWMSCVTFSTGQVNCKVFESLLDQPTEIQITRALMIASILFATIAALMSMAGMKCTTCFDEDKQYKNKMALAGGIGFSIAGLCALVATSWYGNKITMQFYGPDHKSHQHKYDFGKALFLGWAASSVSVLGGLVMCCNSGLGQRGQRPQQRASAGTNYV